jgi:hypothetical protein
VVLLERSGQADQVAVSQWRETSTDGQGAAHALGHGEGDAPVESSLERGVATGAPAQTEGSGHLVEVDVQAVGGSVQGSSQSAQQEDCRRTEHGEPEDLDVR